MGPWADESPLRRPSASSTPLWQGGPAKSAAPSYIKGHSAVPAGACLCRGLVCRKPPLPKGGGPAQPVEGFCPQLRRSRRTNPPGGNARLGGRTNPPATSWPSPLWQGGAGEVRGPVLYQKPFRRPGGGWRSPRPRLISKAIPPSRRGLAKPAAPSYITGGGGIPSQCFIQSALVGVCRRSRRYDNV